MQTLALKSADGDTQGVPAFDIARPTKPAIPYVFSSPHSGVYYPASFLAQSRLSALALRRSEDSFVDQIFAAAPDFGAPLLKAIYARAYLDLNREAYELDPLMFDSDLPDHINTTSHRVSEGLGTIPRIVAASIEIYRHKLKFEEAEARIAAVYRPYHRALRELVTATCDRFGCAVLIECHSMPSSNKTRAFGIGAGDADIVLGDRFGTSCNPIITDAAEEYCRRMGYSVARNRPYAGGFNTKKYGAPAKNLHALQIEIRRGLYMDERLIEPNPNYSAVRNHFAGLIEELARLTPERLGQAC